MTRYASTCDQLARRFFRHRDECKIAVVASEVSSENDVFGANQSSVNYGFFVVAQFERLRILVLNRSDSAVTEGHFSFCWYICWYRIF